MNITIVAVLLILFMFSLKYFMQKKAKKSQGKSVNIDLFNDEIKALLNQKKSIIYFYTPTCGACKAQAPIIDRLKRKLKNVEKIDLSGKNDIVKEFGMMGTPTTVLMKGNTISEIFVGLKKLDFLKTKFEAMP